MRTADYLEVDRTPDCDPTASGVQLFIKGKRDGWAALALEELNLISTYPRVHKQMLSVTGIDFNYVCLKTWDLVKGGGLIYFCPLHVFAHGVDDLLASSCMCIDS